MPIRPPKAPRAVHQLLPRLARGDAVGNQVRYLQRLLRQWGYASEVYAPEADPALRAQVRPPEQYAREADRDSVLLVHHSFASGLLPVIARAPGRAVLVYHNITPAPLVERFDSRLAAACNRGRDELEELAGRVDLAFAYSDFSAAELRAAGIPRVERLPFAIDWAAFDVPPDAAVRARYSDGMRNVLFVGRGVPSKRIEDVLRVFAAYQRLYRPDSRLLVAGELHRDSAYGAWVHSARQLLGAERVHLLGRVGQAELAALFSVAHAYLSMSAHEGFGVPLLEAMHHGVPVVAYGAAAVPETLGGAGLCTFTRDPLEVARLLAVLDAAPELRARVVEAQAGRLSQVRREAAEEHLRAQLAPVLEGTTAPGRASATSPRAPDVVCPGFDAEPESPPARIALQLVERLASAGGVRLLLAEAREPHSPRPLPPGVQRVAFPLDLPAVRGEPTRSSALEMAVRTSGAPTVLVADHPCLSDDCLGRIRSRTWAALTPSASQGWSTALRRHLGPRLFDPSAPLPAELARGLLRGQRPFLATSP